MADVIIAGGANPSGTSPFLATSPDGATWTAQSTPDDSSSCFGIYSLATDGAGNFVAAMVGAGSAPASLMFSSDGVSWSTVLTGSAARDMWSVIWVPFLSLWIAGGDTGAGPQPVIWTSPDGHTWTAQTTPWDGCGTFVNALGQNGSIVVAGGSDCSGDKVVMTSTDGITWTVQTTPFDSSGGFGYLNAIIWAAFLSLFIGVGDDGTGTHCLMTSPDGISWTARTTPLDGKFATGVATDGTTVIMVGSDFGNPMLATSPDAVTWTAGTTPWDSVSGSSVNTIYYDSVQSLWVMGAGAPTGDVIASSPNGSSWTLHSSPFGPGSVSSVYSFISGPHTVLPPTPPPPAPPEPEFTCGDAGSTVTYRFYDAVTALPLDALPLSQVEFGQTIATIDTFKGTFIPSDPRASALNWRRATQPNKAIMVVDVCGSPERAYIVQTRKRTKSKQEVELTGSTLDAWMKQRIQAQGYDTPPVGGRFWSGNPADPIAIAAQVIWDALTSSGTIPSLMAEYCGICGFDPIIRYTDTTTGVSGPVPPITGCQASAAIVTSGDDLIYIFGVDECAVVGSDVSGPGLPGGTTVTEVTEYVRAPGIWHSTTAGTISASATDVINVKSAGYPLEVGMLVEFATHFPPHTYVADLGPVTVTPQAPIGHPHLTTSVGPGSVSTLQVSALPYGIDNGESFYIDGDTNVPPILFVASAASAVGSTSIAVHSVSLAAAIVAGSSAVLRLATVYQYAFLHTTNPAASGGSAVLGTIGGWYTIRTSNHAGSSTAPALLSFSNGSGPTPKPYWINGKFAKHQGQTVESIVQKMSQMGYIVGFDYSFDVAYLPGSFELQLTINFWYPTQEGNADIPVSIYSSWCSEVEYDEDGTSQASGTQESGKALGGRVTGAIGIPAIPVSGYLLTENCSTHTAVTDLAELEALEEADLDTYAWPVSTLTLTLPLALDNGVNRPGDDPKFRLRDFAIGDLVDFFVDGTLPDEQADFLWPGGMQSQFQIQAWKATVNESGVSELELVCIVPPQALISALATSSVGSGTVTSISVLLETSIPGGFRFTIAGDPNTPNVIFTAPNETNPPATTLVVSSVSVPLAIPAGQLIPNDSNTVYPPPAQGPL